MKKFALAMAVVVTAALAISSVGAADPRSEASTT